MTGNYLFGARQFNPTLGTWTSADPSGFAAGDVNLYRAFGNNPVNRTDPSGLDRHDDLNSGLPNLVNDLLLDPGDVISSVGITIHETASEFEPLS